MTTRKAKEETGNGNFWKTPVWEVTKPVAVGIVVFFAGAIGDKILSGSKVDALITRVEFLEGREKINSRYVDEEKKRKQFDSIAHREREKTNLERQRFHDETLRQQRYGDSLMRELVKKSDAEMLEAISKPIIIAK